MEWRLAGRAARDTLDGINALVVDGLTINGAANCQIGGLFIINFGGNGISILNGAQSNTIGGGALGNRNVISANGNDDNGVRLLGPGVDNNVIVGNYIGTDVTGTADLGNVVFGIQLWSGKSNMIGGTTPGQRNIISGNDIHGVWIAGPGADNNVVVGNHIGVDVTGLSALGNSGSGVELRQSAQFNIIGGTTAGERNIISANGSGLIFGQCGVVIGLSGTDNNMVTGNYIGTDGTGTRALGNTSDGVLILSGAQSNTIGGTTVGERNIISGNGSNGVQVNGAGTDNNVVKGNFIGIAVNGTADLGNSVWGIGIVGGAQFNTIGGTTAGERNVISGNGNDGVQIAGAGTDNNIVTFGASLETELSNRQRDKTIFLGR